jgi:hypothetical protein
MGYMMRGNQRVLVVDLIYNARRSGELCKNPWVGRAADLLERANPKRVVVLYDGPVGPAMYIAFNLCHARAPKITGQLREFWVKGREQLRRRDSGRGVFVSKVLLQKTRFAARKIQDRL